MKKFKSFENDDYDLGNWLDMLRSRAGLTQEELARLTDVSDTTIRKWENGSTVPRVANLKKLLEVYRQREVLTPGQEQAEASRVWTLAGLNAAFDEAWFRGLAAPASPIANAADLSKPPSPAGATLNGLTRPRHNLPQRSYLRFVGRQEELQKLIQLLLPYPRSRHFVVTVDGIGGVGKSALAIELAYYYYDNYALLPPEERFEQIVWISAKRTLLTARGIQSRPQTFNTVGDLYREIAAVLEEPAILQAGPDQQRGLVERLLARRRTLLIVDNLETVDDEELLAFLRELPDPTKALITTRHRIDIAYAVRLTGMPQEDALKLMNLEAEYKGVELPPATVDEFYRKTGGLPLAIVWSIGLMSLGNSVESILRRLGSGHSDIARFCFEQSVAVIRGGAAYRLLLVLALFDSHVSRSMLGDIAGLGDDDIGRDDALADLLQLSLVNQKKDRFSLLPLTRVYALDELAAQPELETTLRQQWIAHLTGLARPFARPGMRWHNMRPLLQEGKHLLTLALWCQHPGRLDALLPVLPAAVRYCSLTGQLSEANNLAQSGLDYARLVGDWQTILAVETSPITWVLRAQDRLAEAAMYSSEALEIARRLNDPEWLVEALLNRSRVLNRLGQNEQATAFCQEAAAVSARVRPERQVYTLAAIEYQLSQIALNRKDWPAAQAHLLAARDIYTHQKLDPAFKLEYAWSVLGQFGIMADRLGNHEAALQMYRQSLDFFKETGNHFYIAGLLVRLAGLEERCGNRAEALAYAQEALDLSTRLGMSREKRTAEALRASLIGG